MKSVQQNIFSYKRIGGSPTDDLLKESYEIVHKSIVDNNPYAVVLMLSGGDDSITALHVATMLGVKIDFIMHGVTGTGLPAVRKYVHEVADKYNIPLIEANAGNAYESYVRRKGFFGKGNTAHSFAYHILKVNPFDRSVSRHIRNSKSGRKIIFLNGVRVEESDNRADNFGDNPYRWVRKNDLWVNIIHWFTKKQSLSLLESENVKRSPVAIALGRSGECFCGTMQSEADIIAASQFDPTWGKWMYDLRKEITKKFGWDINQNPKKEMLNNIKNEFMPMCVGCKSKNNYSLFE